MACGRRPAVTGASADAGVAEMRPATAIPVPAAAPVRLSGPQRLPVPSGLFHPSASCRGGTAKGASPLHATRASVSGGVGCPQKGGQKREATTLCEENGGAESPTQTLAVLIIRLAIGRGAVTVCRPVGIVAAPCSAAAKTHTGSRTV